MNSSAKSWHPDRQQLTTFAQGGLPPAERMNLQAHLDQCAACRQDLTKLAVGCESLNGQETTPPVDAAKVAAAPPLVVTTDHRPGTDVPADLVDHPRYEILQLLGQGGMGAVYKARHKKMDRLVALKIINAKLLDNPKTVERFQREVKAAAKLHHPNIVTAFDSDEAGSTHFLVMEFVEGTDLAKYVAKKGPLPIIHACHFIRQAALGLQHAHEHGMVHRDIKPHNFMLTAQGVVKVMDFGLARLAREEAGHAGLTGENVLMGTADYIAPEQAEDAHKADIRADIYSLGCSLYHLLAGKAPFAGGTVVQKIMAHATMAVPLADLPATVPGELRTVLAKMVEKNPAQRYQMPGEVAQALAPFVKKTGAKPPAEQLGRKRWNRGWLVPTMIAAAIFALLLATAIVFLPSRESRSPAKSDPGADASRSPEQKQAAALPAKFTNSLGMEFVLVPKGKFLTGGGGGQVGDKEVEIPHDFYLGKYEVTQSEWEAVTGTNPSAFSRTGGAKDEVRDIPDAMFKRFPVENVSWNDAQLFLEGLNKREKEEGWVYRLPKEGEWEYACRGGPSTNKFDYAFDFYFDKPTNQFLSERANFQHEKWLKRPCKVGLYMPNRLGLYDMHGNVREWCDDEEKTVEGTSRRPNLGGCWFHHAVSCRASRESLEPSHRSFNLGIRLARVSVGKEPIAPPPPNPPEPVNPVGALSPAFKNSLSMEFVLVPKGKFLMGGSNGIVGNKEVEIPNDFYLGKYEVTQGEWDRVTRLNPSHFSRVGEGKDVVKDILDTDLNRFPVENVSWNDAQLFLKLFNTLAKETGWMYRLPKEAEWEYACRGGPTSNQFDYSFDFYFDKPTNQLLPEQANFTQGPEKGLKRTCKVGSYQPNRLGLYDMHGNVYEWCDDAENGANEASHRVNRGGCWLHASELCRAAFHGRNLPSALSNCLGLRVTRVAVAKEGK